MPVLLLLVGAATLNMLPGAVARPIAEVERAAGRAWLSVALGDKAELVSLTVTPIASSAPSPSNVPSATPKPTPKPTAKPKATPKPTAKPVASAAPSADSTAPVPTSAPLDPGVPALVTVTIRAPSLAVVDRELARFTLAKVGDRLNTPILPISYDAAKVRLIILGPSGDVAAMTVNVDGVDVLSWRAGNLSDGAFIARWQVS
jgi:hypothetical protein